MIAQADMFPDVHLRPEEDTDERYTPRALILEEQRLLGARFTLDVAATEESAKAPMFYRKGSNALVRPWVGHVWCNPPFSDIEPWVARAWAVWTERIRPRSITMLLPAWTDRGWWHEHVEPYRDARRWEPGYLREPRFGPDMPVFTTRFLPGRVRFGIPGNPDGLGAESPPFWCVLLRWRLRPVATSTGSAASHRADGSAATLAVEDSSPPRAT